ncbi:Ig-like domain-containing protein [Pseudoclavibacter sp. AY1H1]|uniref:DUF7507 domain-containing protein n=1 Tax=Pseudoclavibacter sp. AY1H1 TaxID=2080584 RepID=UPI000CE77F22|nr:Ig-like domain-containing protein [Pseudoclavibacter sp. AY1H1]PPF32618.1 hypothetical protein C5E05_19125 [Pseudoclavibacter sp. AY1H1]
MTKTEVATAPARSGRALVRTLSAGAVGVIAFSALAMAPGAAAASAAQSPGFKPMAASTANYADVFSNVKVDSADPVRDDGALLWRTAMAVSFDMAIPDDAVPGDTFTVKIAESGDFLFRAFDGLEIKSADGTVVATAKSAAGDRGTMFITLTDAVAVSSGIVGSTTVTVQPVADPEEDKTATLTLVGADGSILGPGTSYTIAHLQPASTGHVISPRIINGNEVGLLVASQYVDKNATLTAADLAGARTEVTASKGALPNCDGDFTVGWITEGGTKTVNSGYKAVVESCDLETGKVVLSMPAGVTVPEGVNGFTFYSEWVADTPAKSYEFTGPITGQGQTVEKTGRGTSPSLAGAADGVVRPAQTTVAKTSDAPDRLLPGMEVVYTITTKNLEELRTAYDLKTVDTLPAGVEFISASQGGQLKPDGTVVWGASDYAPGQEKSVRVRVKVLDTAADLITNKVVNTGSNTCFEGDDTGSVCEASVSDTLTRVGLELDKQELGVEDSNGDGTTGNAGDQITYGFNVTNTGNAPESTITLTDKLLGIDGVDIILDVPLEPKASIMLPGEYVYTITVEDEKAESVLNEATVSVPDGPPVGDSVETPVTPAPAPTPTATPTTPASPAATPVGSVDLVKTGADAQAALWTGGGIIAAALATLGTLVLRRRKAAAASEQD